MRKQIDECDNNLMQELAKRMRVAREIGTFKKEQRYDRFCKRDVTMKFWINAVHKAHFAAWIPISSNKYSS